MTTQKEKSSFAGHEALPLGSINKLNHSITDRRFEPGQEKDFSSILANVFKKIYGTDIKSGSGPYMAVVLDVLVGASADKSAEIEGTTKTKSNSVGAPRVQSLVTAATNSPEPVTVIAKIPEFDADIPWPENDKDQKRIQLHGEFVQIGEGIANIANIKQGSIIWVQYQNDDTVSHSGAPTGYILGVHTAALLATLLVELDLDKTFNPPCKITIDKNKPAHGFYVGEGTDQDPYPSLVDFKIKSHIKTGMYGGGHPRTKAHFKAALLSFDKVTSHKHKLGSPAPGPDNAFIWIGHLKNNIFTTSEVLAQRMLTGQICRSPPQKQPSVFLETILQKK